MRVRSAIPYPGLLAIIRNYLGKTKAALKRHVRRIFYTTLPVSFVSLLPSPKLQLARIYHEYGYGHITSGLILDHFRDDRNISSLLAVDQNRKIEPGLRRFPTENIENVILSDIIGYNLQKSSKIEALLNEFGYLHLGAIVRACLLINITSVCGTRGRQSREFLQACIEIAGSDYAQDIIFSRGFLPGEYRALMLAKLREIADWPRDKRLSVFLEPDVTPERSKVKLINGSAVFLKGPSVRSSNLAASDSDLICAIAFSGSSSPAPPCDRVDVSRYRLHKLDRMLQDDSIHALKQLRLAVLTSQSAEAFFSKDHRHRFKSQFHAIDSPVQAYYSMSLLNAGVECFIFLLLSGASKVYVANFDLFLNRHYPARYIANRTEDKVDRRGDSYSLKNEAILELFRHHSPGQQLAVYQFFGRDCGVIYDDVLSEIVSMQLSDYVEALENTYRIV